MEQSIFDMVIIAMSGQMFTRIALAKKRKDGKKWERVILRETFARCYTLGQINRDSPAPEDIRALYGELALKAAEINNKKMTVDGVECETREFKLACIFYEMTKRNICGLTPTDESTLMAAAYALSSVAYILGQESECEPTEKNATDARKFIETLKKEAKRNKQKTDNNEGAQSEV